MKNLITIEEVCQVARVSKPTIYRKVKLGQFPAPVKVPTTATRGPKMVNRWEKDAVLSHCIQNVQRAATAAVNIPPEDVDAHWHTDPEPWYVEHKFALQAMIGGMLAALAVWFFQ